MDYSNFDSMFDLKELVNDIKEASSNTSNTEFKDVPAGTYEVALTKIELAESSKNLPMVKVRFKVLAGEYADSYIFMNQVITKGFQIHIMNNFLKSLETDVNIEFESYTQYAELLEDVFTAIDGKLEYGLEYGQNAKGFNTFTITDVFEV